MTQGTKRILLTFISIIIIVVFFNVEFYRDWFRQRVLTPLSDMPDQFAYMEPEERLTGRLGSSYYVSVNIAKYLKDNKLDKGAVILLPPKDYIKENNAEYGVPEPVIFYYYTGLKAKWPDSPGADTSKFAIIYQNHNLQLIPLQDTFQRNDLLRFYKKYKIHL
jgi:hypothetical protein